LVRQCGRKVNFVDSLVDSSAQIVEAIWPLSSVACRQEMGNKGVLPLRTFIQETLRRSRTSYSTLQVALYYLILIKPYVPKHDFTMEQPEDMHSTRALQCGRRMFLSALILASKYLQDRNYSARAWSKISGLNTQEINQNEMAFLLAVNWKLHITDAVFQRWTDIVLKYTPSLPPPPGGIATDISTRQANDEIADWKSIILRLSPELDNIDDIVSLVPTKATLQSISACQAKPVIERSYSFSSGSNESTPTLKSYSPHIMEPSLSTVYSTSKPAPALGLLPTPRLTPQSAGFCTPAVSAASFMLGRGSMGYAMAQVSGVCAAQTTDKWPCQPTSSPYVYHRRSSLANSASSMSSPESMVSDNSSRRSSRSSSISSASSLMSAPLSSKLDVQARCRYAKQCSEKNARNTILSVPEEFSECATTASPESYTGPVGKDFLDLSLDTPLARQENEVDYFSKDLVNDAARALQELHNHPRQAVCGAKRSRPQSTDLSLQENVREMLSGRYNPNNDASWSDDFVRSRSGPSEVARKRVCCAAEASNGFPQPGPHPAFTGLNGRPGMWEGILN